MNNDQDTALHAAIKTHLKKGRLPCVDAFSIAQELSLPPLQVAQYAEGLGTRIGWCQLGLFETEHREVLPPPVEVTPETGARIEAALEEGALPCAKAWSVAKELGLDRLSVGRAADAMGVRISDCQLGCFP
jgi:hypothetical protein